MRVLLLNKICSAEGLTFDFCTSLNHFIVRLIESVLEQTLQWSSIAMLNFLSSFGSDYSM